MATYKEIRGTNIEVLSSDPSNPIEGQVWYNSTSNVLKGRSSNPAGSWTTANSINTARGAIAGAGTTTAAIIFGGEPYSADTEIWNGTNWTEVNNLNVARAHMGAAGIYTAALGFGGLVDPSPPSQPTINISLTESWNGTNWTEVNDMNTARYGVRGAGTQTAALATAGNVHGVAVSNTNETWNGTNWTEVNDVNTARTEGVEFGATNTESLYAGGSSGATVYAQTESWNGTNWTEVNDLNLARNTMGGNGIQTSGIAYGGNKPPPVGALTEQWNGTNWTEVADLNTARNRMGAAGTSGTVGLAAGGYTPPSTAVTEEFVSPLESTVTFTDS